MAGKKPDYRVWALLKSAQDEKSDYKNNNVGAAWINPNGSITVKIDPFIVLNGGPDLLITLFPRDDIPSDRTRSNPDDERPF